jgi:hypothetical protein
MTTNTDTTPAHGSALVAEPRWPGYVGRHRYYGRPWAIDQCTCDVLADPGHDEGCPAATSYRERLCIGKGGTR